jgi:hypothetical protein
MVQQLFEYLFPFAFPQFWYLDGEKKGKGKKQRLLENENAIKLEGETPHSLVKSNIKCSILQRGLFACS